MPLTCVIIDDEPLARECLEGYIREVEFLQLIGTGTNPVELTHLMNTYEIDLIFLDIQMPVMNGIDFLRMNPKTPLVIITTAYPSFALEGFRLDVLDYLLKPVTFERFFKAVTKANEYHQMMSRPATEQTTSPQEDYFFVKCEYKYERIDFADILYIQGLQNYVTIYTRKGKHITLLSLKHVEKKLDAQFFIRVHKSYIVSISKIDAIEGNAITVGSARIPISRNYREAVIEQVVNNRLWKKSGDP